MRRETIGQLGEAALVQQGVDLLDIDGLGEGFLALRFGDDRGPANDEIHRDSVPSKRRGAPAGAPAWCCVVVCRVEA
jgi:hypothetical protein